MKKKGNIPFRQFEFCEFSLPNKKNVNYFNLKRMIFRNVKTIQLIALYGVLVLTSLNLFHMGSQFGFDHYGPVPRLSPRQVDNKAK